MAVYDDFPAGIIHIIQKSIESFKRAISELLFHVHYKHDSHVFHAFKLSYWK